MNAPDKMPPFSPEEMEEMMKREAALKEARKVWLPRFTQGSDTVSDVTIPYLLYTPEKVSGKAPLVVFLHGIGGCGSDNIGQLTDNDALIDWVKAQDNGMLEPCYILAPQCKEEIPNLRWEYPYLDVVARSVDSVMERYAVDPERVYLTGLSLGGFGAWNLNRMYPEKFAAVVSLCSACLKGTVMDSAIYEEGIRDCAEALVNKPVWMFHSEDDFVVPVAVTKRMAEKFAEAGKVEGIDYKVTIYPADKHYNHGCWDPAYKDPELFSWLMSQRLK